LYPTKYPSAYLSANPHSCNAPFLRRYLLPNLNPYLNLDLCLHLDLYLLLFPDSLQRSSAPSFDSMSAALTAGSWLLTFDF